ncbi:MAG TPA: carboxypeptidase-like regulatory domain-containing protein [Candidatus Coprenecus avistercoris]|uniref:Carboxypeptidase-like regulatory domain-containing protein n=1 Tax=Candidatus Coprenecus avistercoris TaxID=2840730 RepID=A0A9D1E1N7_9BACT|nr:carboxypeptidase-like regulatory domain-containing protein [Candidatus Coprenecus avistercoris]
MRKITIISAILLVWGALTVRAKQSTSLAGAVYTVNIDGKKEPVAFATVYWAGSGLYADCDDEGRFTIGRMDDGNGQLVAAALGYVYHEPGS